MKLKKLKDWGLFSKIIGLLSFTMIALVLFIFLYILPTYRDNLFEEKRISIRQLVQVASSVIEKYQKMESAGLLTTDEAQQKALNELKQIRYNTSDYFWINNSEPRMIMHPIKPQLDGKILTDIKDPNGVHLFVEFVDVCKKDGHGYVDYMWEKPGHKDPQPKVSYVQLNSKWDWILGSGIYIDDVEEQISAFTNKILLILGILVPIIFLLGYFFTNILIKPIKRLELAAYKVAQGEVDIELDSGADDEIGKLSQSFKKMISNIKESSLNAEEISEGNLNIDIQPKSERDVLAISLKKVVQNVNNLVTDTNQLSESAIEGKLSSRINEDNHKGEYKKVVSGFNNTLNAIANPLTKL